MDVTCSIRVWNTVRDKLQSVCIKGWGNKVKAYAYWVRGLATTRRFVRDGRSCATQYGTSLVELGKGCEVEVRIPCVPEKALTVGVFVSPRPGVPLRETCGWKPLLHTPSSGVWVLPGALQSVGFLGLLDVAGSWVSRSTYRTAWAVCPWSGCQCSYSYGHGPAVGPHTGRGCFRYLASVRRAIAPLLSPWCADVDVPSAANLNLDEGSRSHVSWQLIVSLSLGSSVTF